MVKPAAAIGACGPRRFYDRAVRARAASGERRGHLRLAALLLPALTMLALLTLAAPAVAAPKLKVGVGRADITPPTGYDTFGYVRADGRVEGALSRLWAKVIVLEQGGEKLALVSEDLGGIPGGMFEDAIARVADRGFSVSNVLDSATHTHSGPTGFFNFPTYNTVL